MRCAVLVFLATAACGGLLGCDEEPGGGVDAAQQDGRAPRRKDRGGGKEAGRGAEAGTPDTVTGREGTAAAHDCQRPASAWLLCEYFEGMSKGFDAWLQASAWTEALGETDRGRLTTSTEAHRGSYALYMPAAASSGYQGGDLIWRACAGAQQAGCKPLLGYPRLYLRAWIKFAADHKYVHHFLNVGGGPLDDYWAPYGNAGCRPNGKRGMGTTVDFAQNTHESFFYTYHLKMSCDPGPTCDKYADATAICAGCAAKGMPCSSGEECCWGNLYKPSPAVALPVDRWFCLELMMRPNDVGQDNGEMAYWVDDKLAHQASGIGWRTDTNLQMNMARLQHYITTSDAQGHANRVWFDDVVISTNRIGCN